MDEENFNDFNEDIINIDALIALDSERSNANDFKKDYTFSNKLPEDIDSYNLEKGFKPQRIYELEKTFSKMSDGAFHCSSQFRSDALMHCSNELLIGQLDYYLGTEDKQGEVQRLYELNEEYEKLTGKKDPNYGKYANFTSIITSELEKELVGRKKFQESLDWEDLL